MSTETTQIAAPEQMQPQAWGDPTGKGLIAGMDEFFDGPAAPIAKAEPVKSAEPVYATPAEPVKAAEAPVATPVKEVVSKPAEKPVEAIEGLDEGFSKADELEPVVKDPGAFDEAAFDKQTEEEVKGMDAKAGEKFKALKAELKAAKQAAPPAALTQELEELKTKAQETEGLRERIKELSGVSAKVMVENDDQYIKEVREPWGQIHAKLDKLSEVYEMDPSVLRSLVREDDMRVQDEMIKTHLAGFSEVRKQEVFQAIGKVTDLLDKHAGFMENAEKEMGQREAKRIEATEKSLADQRKAVQTIQKDKWSRWEKAIPGLLDDDGEPTLEYTKMKNESLSLDFSQARASDQAFAALAGTLLPFAQKQIISLQRELSEYRAGDKKALKAKPDTGSSVVQIPAGAKKARSFMDDFMEADLVL
jgi:hypothetical protein